MEGDNTYANVDYDNENGLKFSELKENIQLLKKPPNWGICIYDTGLIIVEIREDLTEGFKIIINDNMEIKFLHCNECLSWMTLQKICSIQHLSKIIDTLSQLPF